MKTAEEVWISAGECAGSRTSTTAQTTSERTEPATSANAIREQTVEKLEANEVRTVNFTTNNCLQGESLKSERMELPQVTNSGGIRLYPSSNDVMKIKEIFLDQDAKTALFRARTYNVEGSMEITRKIQTFTLFFFHAGVDPNPILNETYRNRGKMRSALECHVFANSKHETTRARRIYAIARTNQRFGGARKVLAS